MIQFFGKHHNSQYFDRQKIQSIAIRAGSRLDALVINGVRYGGDGGGLSETLTLRPSEHINCVIVRSGSSIDGIDIYTNHGRHIGGGGNGGAEHIVTGRLLAIGGWHDNLMRGLEIETVAEDSQQVLRFGDLNSPDFAVSPIQSIALRSGSLVDGIIINGTQYGGGGGGLSQTLTLQSGEFISRVVVRHDNHLTHKLEFYTNYNRSLIGGGGGGWSTTIDGKLLGLGGKSLNNFLGGFATWIDRDRACTFANLAAANRFAPQAIQSIALRSGSLIDAIIINGTQYGGGGGGLSETLTLQSGEFITRVLVRHDGWTIHRLDFFTSNGRQLSGGGNGGSEHVIEGNLRAIGGATSNMVNGLTLTVGPDPIEVVSYGGGGGASFPMHWVENRNTIRIDHDFRYYSSNRVEALVLDGQRYGGSDDIDGSSSLTLGQGEFINKILVRHGSRVDRLEISTSRNRKVTGGGNGGTQDIYHGRVRALGGRAGGALDRLTVMGRRGVIDNSPSMQDVGGTSWGTVKTITFNKNGYPLDFHSLFGHRWQHLQDMIRLPDANGKRYYMGTYSQNCDDSEGGMVFVCELEPNQTSGNVIWCDVLNNRHVAGGYNHPGDLRRIGSTVVIAGQNWHGTTKSAWAVRLGGDAMHVGDGGNHVLFYDVSNPARPFYFGKLNSCWDGDTLRGTGEIDSISAVAANGRYYLSFNGLQCWADAFSPDVPWYYIKSGDIGSPSPALPTNGSPGIAKLDKNTRQIGFYRLDFTPALGPGTTGVSEVNVGTTNPVPLPSFSNWTFSLNTISAGSTVGVYADVESDSVIRIAELT